MKNKGNLLYGKISHSTLLNTSGKDLHIFIMDVSGKCFNQGERNFYPFSYNFVSGKNFYQVAVHEIGHALGLAHSRHINAVMNPFYQGYNKNFRLDKDDIEGIQLIYGK